MKDINFFLCQFEEQMKTNEKNKKGNNVYGSNVIPIIKLYKNLEIYEERKSFLDAIEMFLGDKDENKRKYAILICSSFIVFRE